jgi:hypothetical protein
MNVPSFMLLVSRPELIDPSCFLSIFHVPDEDSRSSGPESFRYTSLSSSKKHDQRLALEADERA